MTEKEEKTAVFEAFFPLFFIGCSESSKNSNPLER